jgi:peptidoglycan/xylan/chitin deacetylase (PgdA/CDA1 family)
MTDGADQAPIWPAGYRAALCLSFDVDGHYGEANYRKPDETYWISQTAYDPVGVVRLLDLLADTGVPATFCWVGRAAEDHPPLVERAVAEGHEVALHSWDHRYYHTMTDEEQRSDMLRTFETLSRISKTTPTGHKTAGWRFNEFTHRLAQELGLDWVMDIPTGDLPELMQPDPFRPPLVQLPPSWLYDDYNFFVDRVLTPQSTFEFWRDDLEVIRTEGKLMCLTLHPFVSGRPGPSRAIARLIDHAIDAGDVWIARADHLARWWLERHAEQEEQPSCDETFD